ncbi:hypothetical protein EJB05_02540, partial [Eragrostis curvula]
LCNWTAEVLIYSFDLVDRWLGYNQASWRCRRAVRDCTLWWLQVDSRSSTLASAAAARRSSMLESLMPRLLLEHRRRQIT